MKPFVAFPLLAAAVFAPAAALASPTAAQIQALPDFPTSAARPGDCWARSPIGGAAPAALDGDQSVWTLKRGYGPEAVWRYERRPAPASAPAAPSGYTWVQVECDPNAPRTYAQAAPQPAPPVMPQAPAPDAGAPMTAPPQPPMGPHQGPLGPQNAPLGQPQGPMAHPQGPMGPQNAPLGQPQGPMAYPQGPMGPPPGPLYGAPPPHGPHHAPMPAQPPRWFGDRFLSWPGKR